MKYNILNSIEEIELSKEEINPFEEECRKFNFSIKRGTYTNFHRLLKYFGACIFARMDISHFSKVCSAKTTGFYRDYRFFHLFLILMKNKPKVIYEFGSGASTVFMAEVLRYLDKKYSIHGKIMSFEQSPKYYDLIQNHFPDELREYAEISLKPLKYKKYQDYRGLHYLVADYPKTIDFVYIDGASRTRGDSNTQNFWIMSDIIEIIQSGSLIKYAITDHRYTNYPAYKKILNKDYKIKLSKPFRSIVISHN